MKNDSLNHQTGASAARLAESDGLRVEEALRRDEHFLAEAQRLSHTGSFGWRADGGEIVWSDETYCIFEYNRTEKPTLDMVMQRIDPQDRILAQQVTERVFEDR